MTDLVLGSTADDLVVELVTSSDFSQSIESRTPDGTPIAWPEGVSVRLEFATGQVWTAVISGADATFTADHSDADAIQPGTSVALVFTQAGLRQIPNRGRVSRDR